MKKEYKVIKGLKVREENTTVSPARAKREAEAYKRLEKGMSKLKKNKK